MQTASRYGAPDDGAGVVAGQSAGRFGADPRGDAWGAQGPVERMLHRAGECAEHRDQHHHHLVANRQRAELNAPGGAPGGHLLEHAGY